MWPARSRSLPRSSASTTDWSGRQAKRIRVEVRRALGFRRCGVGDADKLTRWLAEHVGEADRRRERVLAELLARCPDAGRLKRFVATTSGTRACTTLAA